MSSHRTIRLFLSSTFRDFAEERDLLVKRVFPALRAKLKDRFVELVDVDLRWGITAEEAERGEVLPICLAEIDRARPYFIGMLGERYGWIPPPDGYAADLLERQPWLKKHQGGKSVTELEILHGVLNNRRMRGRAFFYFRSPSYARMKGGDYLPSPEDRARQAELKRSIREQGLPVIAYANPEALAKRIERDLWKLLDAEFPATSVPDAFERERLRHEAYAAPRRRLYLGGERYQAALAKLLEAEEPRIVIEGASGGGKSALLANFFEAYRKRHPRLRVHEHYLGASADAADPHALVRRLIEFIQRTTHSREEIPGDPQGLMDSLPIWLATASAWARKRKTRFIFVLDSLNSLTDQQDLRWWPAFLPRGITMLVSCLPGPVYDALKGKTEPLPGQDKTAKWKTVTVRSLTKAQSVTLLNTYLARFNKKLPRQMVKQVQAHPLATNPLFLRTLAEELRLFGVHEELQKRLYHYLASQTIDDLFERVLERVEKDCGKAQVKAALTAVWASRAGLTEKEILGIADLKPATWAPIRHALDEALMDAEGKITFAHDYMRSAVRHRYLPTDGRQRSAHRVVAAWFSSQPADDRRAEEEAWQCVQARAWDRLRACLIDRSMFEALFYFRSNEELLRWWLLLERYRRVSLDAELEAAWARWKPRPNDQATGVLARRIQMFLTYAGRHGPYVERLARLSLRIARRVLPAGDPEIVSSLNLLAEVLIGQGRYQEAIPICRQSVAALAPRYRRPHWRMGWAISLLGEAVARSGDLARAEPLYRRALAINEAAEGLGSPKTAIALNNLGWLLDNMGREEDALVVWRRALQSAEQAHGPKHPETATTLNNFGSVLLDAEDPSEGESMIYRALAICESVLGATHPKTTYPLTFVARIHERHGDIKKARATLERVVALRREAWGADHPEAAIALRNLGHFESRNGFWHRAIDCYRKALRAFSQSVSHESSETINTLESLASTLVDSGDYPEARSRLDEALRLSERTLGTDHATTISLLHERASLASKQGDRALADRDFRRAIKLALAIHGRESPGTMVMINDWAVALLEAGSPASAEPLFREVLAYEARVHGADSIQAARAVNNLAGLLNTRGKFRQALPLHRRAKRLFELQYGETHPATATSLNNLAEAVWRTGQLAEGESLFRQALDMRLATLGPRHPAVARTLHDLGVLLQATNRFVEAAKLYARSLSIRKRVLGPEHPRTLEVQARLEGLGAAR